MLILLSLNLLCSRHQSEALSKVAVHLSVCLSVCLFLVSSSKMVRFGATIIVEPNRKPPARNGTHPRASMALWPQEMAKTSLKPKKYVVSISETSKTELWLLQNVNRKLSLVCRGCQYSLTKERSAHCRSILFLHHRGSTACLQGENE